MQRKNLALRPYVEKIAKICSGLKKEELAALIVNMAGKVDPAQRQDYLETIVAHLPGGGSGKAQPALREDRLVLEELQGLKESILARIVSIEDGSYWDEPDEDWDGYDYDHEDPDFLSEDHQDSLAALFDVAGDEYFMRNRLIEAKALYGALFSLVSEIEEYGFMPDIEIDLKDAHARYCRAVYELAQPKERAIEMAVVMAVTEPQNDFDSQREGGMALFQDVIDVQVGELPGLAEFLPQWQDCLTKEGHTPDRLARLRLEVAFMISGLVGVQKLALSWQAKQPLGYLVWMEYLVRAEKWQDLCGVAKEALAALPLGQNRRYAAGYLVEGGRHCGDDDLVLQGRREAFRSAANAPNLLHLLAEADRRQLGKDEITQAIDILQKGKLGDHNRKPLLAKLYLMAGDLQSLADLGKGEKAYGWSGGSPAALLFSAILYCNSKGDKQCVLINRLLADYTDATVYFDSDPMNNEEPATTFLEQIVKGLDKIDLAKDDFDHHVAWALRNGQKRVESIVSNKHRNAYGRAADTLGAMAEMLATQGKKQQAKELLHKYYFKLYNRHSAFRREVREAVAVSPLLAGMI